MRLVTSRQMRRLEDKAIGNFGIPSILLMENAAMAVVREICQFFAAKKRNLIGLKATVLAGKGNNGGDGLAIARHLTLIGFEVTVFLLAKSQDLTGDAKLNFRLFSGTGGKLFVIEGEKQRRLARFAFSQADVVVDALYGTGLRGAMPSIAEEYIEEINQTKAWVVAVDVPSGVEADTGKVYRIAVRADLTVTFGLPKLGHFLGRGPEFCGQVIVDAISIPPSYLQDEEISNFILTEQAMRTIIPKRQLQNHKGTHGKGILAAGSLGMSGAAILSGRSAIRTGIGLLQIVTPRGVVPVVANGVIEGTVWPAGGDANLDADAWPVIEEHCQGAQALALGPGLGLNNQFYFVLEKVFQNIALPVILDADALNLVALKPEILQSRKGRGPLILTPHPGEMARLCNLTTPEVQENRLELAVNKAVEWGAVVVLKGSITVVAAPDGRAFLNPTGNPGLGTGGTGDVLTGSILSWLAQGVQPLEAACLAVYLHGKAAEILAKEYGWSGFTASELADTLPKARRQIES
ncbi:MAG: NAD(P)H-hydrate dehydratase [Desulfitobacteriaceae bacterium]|nr:NAD(P)H-hydrate dehydratase [Desulfitobacteriaceae bacterium]MDD4345468.1 NAD(P)H-hydrate dehydratase [Desulfitobacteriaceae bacterium]MDD4400684.1 NAD(P)H-hydrate dehydratase [Desulfitobacteriaceae bacterium]